MRRQVYALNITIPSSDVDNCLDPGKAVVHLQVSRRFLAQESR